MAKVVVRRLPEPYETGVGYAYTGYLGSVLVCWNDGGIAIIRAKNARDAKKRFVALVRENKRKSR